jgi:hypothetical protein
MTTANDWDDLGPIQGPFPNECTPLQLKELACAAHSVIDSVRLVFGADEGYIGGDMSRDAPNAWYKICRVMHGSQGEFGSNADNLADALVRLHHLANHALRAKVLVHDPQGKAQWVQLHRISGDEGTP